MGRGSSMKGSGSYSDTKHQKQRQGNQSMDFHMNPMMLIWHF
jgi:hypothetical protein